MKKFIMKHSVVSFMFVYIIKAFFYLIQLVIKVDNRLILFTSFSGRSFNDSPKVVFDSLLKDSDFEEFNFVWGFRNKKKDFKYQQIKTGTFAYLIVLARAKYWISNSSIEQLIPLNSKKHVYINTWHGVPLKFLGSDETRGNFITNNWYKKVRFDLLLSSGKYDNKLFHRIFPNTENIQLTGLPRNIELSSNLSRETAIKHINNKLKLDSNKKIILYAPTFRATSIEDRGVMRLHLSEKMLEKLSSRYTLLVRPHYFVENIVPANGITDVRNLDLESLMQVSDLLITDYSSVMFDYLNLKKPIILYTYDLDDYLKKNGTYINPKSIGLPMANNSEQLLTTIQACFKNENSKLAEIENEFNVTSNKSLRVIKDFIKSH
ncbi:CDP-glycerol glycerophosphotransferase family protein [Pediococcus inopinatus]|uniref:CDP-glycerol glycerophosphotransferase family protein n=1 Tax=Pediococcus inopinatus TaxID=114090 RepID=UPI002A6A0B69|nr:CDP-glycerol glycerophosphotransferase family protein [Pediococcus inopinatus]WPP08689.1 CDP-glycerol glycerophosphotransferase family protein [Pediococcus inopinatus]